ncbi:xanthine dehydrogenase family protein molybdopterin-binding subunit [Deinococcus cavernae]|uniref:Xanthine dehydrogenase family protein molybdopterin-binding subunit n=1 Tax=Deinococcus cavernae TaxID=2320857 RepID=A0A418V048_9DEIO|nr:xanthine dehydrogenase family protein molybdopterin-binding subunit [Deinococcus cavernae]RJF69106.1 xanthine dehydrogenase family protein molybdopterin-binding subunit [Deinococcus cavernae]
MKFDTPADTNPIDQEKVVAQPHPRIEGPLKVTGQATYAAEYHEPRNTAYGFVRGSGIGHGKITRIDVGRAEAAPGVLLVLTHHNTPWTTLESPVPQQYEHSPHLVSEEVNYYGEAVAFVVAETFEQARHAASLIEVEYQAGEADFVLEDVMAQGKPSPDSPDSEVGDFEQAFKEASVKVDVTYTTPDQSQMPMEPHASLAEWQGEQLTLYTSNQMVHWVRRGLSKTFHMPQQDIRIVSRYVGGGFGSKLNFYADAVLSIYAARKLGRPVKTVLHRPLIPNHTTHRPATIQRLRLAADREGHLLAVGHDSYSGNLPGGDGENASDQTKLLYAGPNRLIRTRVSELHLPPGGSMRAPGEAVGLLALECAMDELAEKLKLDPVELRIRNDIQHDPEKGPKRPYSSRKLVKALREGAKAFGWEKRQATPAQVREGEWLIGMGMASAFRKNLVQPSGARVRLERGGKLTVETQMTDIGTGSYTILGQVAAEMLGLRLEDVTVKLGDSDFPKASGSGGSFGANSSTTGLYYACEELRQVISGQFGYDPRTTEFKNGEVWSGNHCTLLAKAASQGAVEAEGNVTWGDLSEKFVQASFGAHFAEVAVNAYTGETRVRRLLSAVTAGRILNPVTARSQCLGGMTMGVGAALMEELHVDERFGLFINHDLAEYHVPVHADIPQLDVLFLDELDDKSSPLKAKGIGELGICGVGAAVANAVYNASGVRIRDYPLTLDKVLAGWEAAD